MLNKIKSKLKEKLNRLNKDDSGSAFVVVALGIMCVSIIGATVLSLATNYAVTVIVDHYSTDNFYQTEGLIAEVRSGIEELAGDCNEKAYMNVIENYSKATGSMRADYGKQYLGDIVAKLTNSVITWDGTDQPERSFQMDIIKKMSTNPSALSSKYGGDTLHYKFNFDDSTKEMSLTIKGLKIDCTDEAGYENKIETDIELTVPDYNFEGDDTFNQLKDYIVISDDELSVVNSVGGQPDSVKGAYFDGNVYTGGVQNSDEYQVGIDIKSQAKAKFNSRQIISRGDLSLLTGSNVSISGGDLWIKNILLASAGDSGSLLSSRLDLIDNTYVLNDLSIDDNNAVVNLGGKYYGYSYSEENSDTVGAQNAKYSSAILVNGMNTTLLSDSLNKLILSGRTFVSRNDKNGAPLVSDIKMGESLAVRSNQIAYLLPDEYIICEHNPLIKSEIDVDNIDASIRLDVLKASPIWTFLNPTSPVTANFNNSGGYVFLYLNFKNQKAANDYFSNFYSTSENKENLDDKAQTYISTTDLSGMKLSAGLYLIAGNIIHNYYAAGGSSKQEANYFDASGNPNTELLLDGSKKMQNYLGKQLALVNSGYKSGMNSNRYELLNSSYKKELVRDVIIDFSKLTSSVSRYDAETGGTIYFTPGDCDIDSSSISKGLVVSGGDVHVTRSFEGLIIAKGKVTVEGQGLNEISNIAMVDDLLDIVKEDSSLSQIFRSLTDKEDKSVNVAECIHYNNWTRNSN